MLIAFLGIIALLNMGLGYLGKGLESGYAALGLNMPFLHRMIAAMSSLESLFGIVLAPVAYLLGVPWQDSETVGGLLGTRTVLNELIAFGQLHDVAGKIGARSHTIATFALCGFANFSSIGIQLGGIGALAPERRGDLARLGFRALLAGTLANFLSACIAGILL
jgi:CNT family concentrative nucleoside transporter